MSGTATPVAAAPVAAPAPQAAKGGTPLSARTASIAKIVAEAPALGAPPASEPAPEPAKPAPVAPVVDGSSKPDPKLASALSAAMRREAMANAAKISAEKAQKAAEAATKLQQDFERDPIGTITKLKPGLYKEWTEQLVKGAAPQPADPEVIKLKETVAALEAQVKEGTSARLSAEEKAARVETMNEIHSQTASDEFELFRAIKGADEAVLSAAIEHFEQWRKEATGEPYQARPWTEYAKAAQEEFIATVKPLLQTKAGRAIVQEIYGATIAPNPQPGESAPQAAIEPMRTVTNNDASAAPAPAAGNKETRAQIIARLRREAEAAKAT